MSEHTPLRRHPSAGDRRTHWAGTHGLWTRPAAGLPAVGATCFALTKARHPFHAIYAGTDGHGRHTFYGLHDEIDHTDVIAWRADD